MSTRIELTDDIDLVRDEHGKYCLVRNAICTPLGNVLETWRFAGKLDRAIVEMESEHSETINLEGVS